METDMILDRETGWVEAEVTINGVTLTFAESMTLRVAVTSFLMQVSNPETAALLGPVSVGYRDQLMNIERKIRGNNA